MKNEQFRSLIKLKCAKAGLEYLLKQKLTKSKMTNLSYKELTTKQYLLSSKISLRKKQMLFKLRTRMMPTPENFGLHKVCKICEIDYDTTKHVLSCIFLKGQVPEVLGLDIDSLESIYSDDFDKNLFFLNIFEKMWRKREELLDKYEVLIAGAKDYT